MLNSTETGPEMRLQTKFSGMHGIPQLLLLSSVLALLAFALFPVVARAGCSTAACLNYELEGAPTLGNEPSTGSGAHHPHQKSHGNGQNGTHQATPAQAETGGAGPGSEAETGPERHKAHGNGSHHQGGEASAGGGGGNPPNPGGGDKNSTTTGAQKDRGHTSTEPHPTHGNGGSSPVLPILIAVAALAALSIGIVVHRQRRSDTSPRPT
jgi:hypothetical protein